VIEFTRLVKVTDGVGKPDMGNSGSAFFSRRRQVSDVSLTGDDSVLLR
jgi:hypothetical protein